MDDLCESDESFDGYGLCADVTREMAAKDPTLIRVRGFYHCSGWGRRHHWWLKDANGKIIDPTASQFPSYGSGEYEEYDPKKHITPLGKCMFCGKETFKFKDYCNEECLDEIKLYYGRLEE